MCSYYIMPVFSAFAQLNRSVLVDPEFQPGNRSDTKVSRHTGGDCRYPGHKDVLSGCRPWHLGSSIPCPKDAVSLNLTDLGYSLPVKRRPPKKMRRPQGRRKQV